MFAYLGLDLGMEAGKWEGGSDVVWSRFLEMVMDTSGLLFLMITALVTVYEYLLCYGSMQ